MSDRDLGLIDEQIKHMERKLATATKDAEIFEKELASLKADRVALVRAANVQARIRQQERNDRL